MIKGLDSSPSIIAMMSWPIPLAVFIPFSSESFAINIGELLVTPPETKLSAMTQILK